MENTSQKQGKRVISALNVGHYQQGQLHLTGQCDHMVSHVTLRTKDCEPTGTCIILHNIHSWFVHKQLSFLSRIFPFVHGRNWERSMAEVSSPRGGWSWNCTCSLARNVVYSSSSLTWPQSYDGEPEQLPQCLEVNTGSPFTCRTAPRTNLSV